METKVRKWGNSLALRIPKAFADELHLDEEAAVELTLRDGQLLVSPRMAPRFRLDDLLAEIRDDNLHPEVDMGPTVGKEIW